MKLKYALGRFSLFVAVVAGVGCSGDSEPVQTVAPVRQPRSNPPVPVVPAAEFRAYPLLFRSFVAAYASTDILKMSEDGSEIVNISRSPTNEWYPSWSPDGHHVAFVSFRDRNYDIYVMDEYGDDVR